MLRHTLSIVIAACLVAVVGAQGPKAITAPQHAELFKKNRLVIENVVDKTLESSRVPNSHVKRANSYYAILYKFNKEIDQARQANDSARVDELAKHLGTLLDKGLAPTLLAAKTQVEGGTGVELYIKVKGELMAQLDALLNILGDNPAAKSSLDGVKTRLIDIRLP